MAIITNLLPPTEGVKHQEPNTSAVVQQKELGKGTLYIAESRVVWVGEGGEGLSLKYSNISVHAVSRDVSRFPQECLFLMTCRGDDEENVGGNSSGSSDEDDDEDDPTTEIRFIPENSSTLDTMFRALSECQALHSVEEDDASSYNGEEEEGNEGDEIGAGDPGFEEAAYSNGQNEPMDVGQLDEEGPEH